MGDKNYFKCPICKKSYDTQEKLKAHYYAQHHKTVNGWM